MIEKEHKFPYNWNLTTPGNAMGCIIILQLILN